MKKFVEFFKNARKVVKIMTMISAMLTAVAEVYNQYFPEQNEEAKK